MDSSNITNYGAYGPTTSVAIANENCNLPEDFDFVWNNRLYWSWGALQTFQLIVGFLLY